MIKEGMFIQERYEIVGKIGAGGMADVYKAKDHKLNRFVAVKVLKQEFREDTAFISKFRVEAQSAAGLAHPNIVNVYDVGDDNGIYFIVMELVEGITLKDYIGKKGRLAVREATSIAVQVSMGLQAAHQKGIVHRDIKPQNIIISTDGKVKVTDFGIARAASSNTISSNAMGSVHYSSPEQARGGYSDAKSDIYSLGITMFEMVTGKVPFEGDTTVAIAIKHLQEEMPSPQKFVPDLPLSTVQIINKCTQKSADRRYNDMPELIHDLKESLVNPDGDFVQILALNNNANTIVMSKDDLEQIHNSYDERANTGNQQNYGDNDYNNYGGNGGGYQDGYQNSGNGYQGGYPNNGYQNNGYDRNNNYQNQDYEDSDYDDDDDDDGTGINPKLEKVMTVGSIIIAIVIGCIFLALIANALGIFDFGSGKNKKDTETPKVTEMTTDTNKETQKITENETVKTDTPQTTKPDSTVNETVSVPDLSGMSEADAKSKLNQMGLGAHYAGEQSSSIYAKGQIVSQTPEPNASVSKNTTIEYTVSKGPEEQQPQSVSVPDMTGMTLDEATSSLAEYGLSISSTTESSDMVASNLVIRSTPGAGESASVGDTVIVVISSGPDEEQATVPSVIGSSVADAKATLEALGFIVNQEEQVSDTYTEGTIMDQVPASGNLADKGTTVTITVSAGMGDPEETSPPESSGSWSCNVGLKAPEGYNGENVKIVLTQGDKTSVIAQDTPVTFPYQLNVQGQPGETSGVAYIYVQDPNSGEYVNPVRYDNIPFKQGS